MSERDLLVAYPMKVEVFISTDWNAPPEKRWAIELTPLDPETEVWPWKYGLAFYGPTIESVISAAIDEAERVR